VFKLNRPTKTKSGETVVPFLVEGRMVSAFDRSKKVQHFNLDDFEFGKTKKTKRIDPKNVVIVKGTPIERVEEEPLFNPNESGGLGGIYEETATVVAEPTTITEPEPTAPIFEIEATTDKEITFIRGSADSDFEPIQTIILSDTFDFTSFGRIILKPSSKVEREFFMFFYDAEGIIKINVNSNYSHEVVKETTSNYSYDDLYGGL